MNAISETKTIKTKTKKLENWKYLIEKTSNFKCTNTTNEMHKRKRKIDNALLYLAETCFLHYVDMYMCVYFLFIRSRSADNIREKEVCTIFFFFF